MLGAGDERLLHEAECGVRVEMGEAWLKVWWVQEVDGKMGNVGEAAVGGEVGVIERRYWSCEGRR